MRFSKKKCKVLRITNKHKAKLEEYPIVFFGGQVLKVVYSHKYLGVTIDSKLTWRLHVTATAEKAERVSDSYLNSVILAGESAKRCSFFFTRHVYGLF